MRLAKVVVSLAALGSLALPAFAQEPLAAPPVMRITVEDIKPGSMGAHDKSVASYQAFFSRAQVVQPRIGMVPVSGDQNQVVYLEGFPSFEALEASDKKVETTVSASPALQAEMEALDKNGGPLRSSQRAMIAVFRPDLSYRPLSASAVGKSRYFGVATTRIKLGRTPDYEGYLKQLNRAREKANIDESTAVYQVTTGAAAGTFMTFTANRSLAEMRHCARRHDGTQQGGRRRARRRGSRPRAAWVDRGHRRGRALGAVFAQPEARHTRGADRLRGPGLLVAEGARQGARRQEGRAEEVAAPGGGRVSLAPRRFVAVSIRLSPVTS